MYLIGETVGEVKAVAHMNQRKAEMAKHSDAFIALPVDIISGIEFDKIGNHLATRDRGGRVVLFEKLIE
ncbi:Cytokinin riboside 5'-monophosphate phosphoribohydrolase LOG [Cynara cardunculus var. scolymus]|uniref:Cytokinin riboside 5'-monophosphate phosphoribohydrolase LOG n=1 Tax=Cynara cardunculus var. scolymus TaxID=59895 RepID=A0A103Y383_CYNCS|nr:Cytokinin riboside 5'-monophosphate phosphoribohydrolase LOG [Cynara cardunculus var. scolymus]